MPSKEPNAKLNGSPWSILKGIQDPNLKSFFVLKDDTKQNLEGERKKDPRASSMNTIYAHGPVPLISRETPHQLEKACGS
jgi:hypothetical protein